MITTIQHCLRDLCGEMSIRYKHVPCDGRFHATDIIDDPRGKGDARLKLFNDGRGGIIYNHKTGEHRTFFVDRCRILNRADRTERQRQIEHGRSRAEAANRARCASTSRFIHQIASECQPLGGPALEYLRGRSCAVPPSEGDLKFHPRLKHRSGYVGPALIGLITHALSRELIGIHRTWLKSDGSGKADVEPAKMVLGEKTNGVIRLWPDDSVERGLAIGEGIESCLSAAHVFRPVWCAIDASNLASLPILNGIESLVIFADNDESGTGQRAAEQCAIRWCGAGKEASTVTSPIVGQDANDRVRT